MPIVPRLPRARSTRRRALGWVEALVVACLVAALVGIACPSFQDNLSESTHLKARQDLEVLRKAMHLRQAREPWTRRPEDLQTLRGRYLQEVPLDPWGNAYRYDPVTHTLSTGGGPGGEGAATLALGEVMAEGTTWMGAPARGTGHTTVAPTDGAEDEDRRLHPFRDARAQPRSTFALDVDSGSFTLAERWVLEGRRLPPRERVRPEEFVNALPPLLEEPEGGGFAIESDLSPSLGRAGRHLVRVQLRAGRPPRTREGGLHLTLLVDVSGSMQGADRLGLVRRSLRELVGRLHPEDHVALLSFSTSPRLLLPMTPASDREALAGAIEGLRAAGGTDVGAALDAARSVARGARAGGGRDRIVLFSDGVANGGDATSGALLRRAREMEEEGLSLSTLGYGMGEYRDAVMEQLADQGGGSYAYVASEEEARRVLGERLADTVWTAAREARAQVEWDPARVRRHRLLGYENRRMEAEAFEDTERDGGEVGAGHAVTALWEVELTAEAAGPRESATPALGLVRLLYQDPASEEWERREVPLLAAATDAPGALRDALAARLAEVLGAPGDRVPALRALGEAVASRRGALAQAPGGERLLTLLDAAATLTDPERR